ncbi:hypothetical protein L6R52_06295 [Myxococcota bacterium]|nr:hypothetical protein [Myxococcota bacterium]
METFREPRHLRLLTTSALCLALGAGVTEAGAQTPDTKQQPATTKPTPVKDTPVSTAKDAARDAKAAQKPADDLFDDETPAGATEENKGPAVVTQKTGPQVLLLPFQPIFRSVPQDKIQRANELIAKELDQKDNVIVLRGGLAKGGAAAITLDGAKAAQAAAEKAEREHDITVAVTHRKKVIEELEKNAAAVEPDDFVRAHHLLARTQMWAGFDKEVMDTLEVAARMRPAFQLEPSEFSRLYRSWFQKAAAKVVADKPTELLVRSALPGALIFLDGRPMDTAPVMLRKVVPGKHLLGARIDGVEPFAAVVDVKPGKSNEYTVAFANTLGGPSVGVVADSIAENGLPAKAVQAAMVAGKEAGAAFVVAGGLAKDDDKFNVHGFVVDVSKGRVAPLDVVNFDLEMLTSESDVLRITLAIASKVNDFGVGESAVATINRRVKSANVVNEVAAAPALTAEDEAKKPTGPVGKDGKKPVRDVFKPLKGTKIEIKDEESD